jgi:hypothetical protein
MPTTAIRVTEDSGIRRAVNIGLYYLFMLFIVIIGGRLSSLGIQLIKEKKPTDKT